jgi:phage tail sheath gpL-like
MPLSAPSGFSSATKTPTIAVAVQLGASSRAAGAAPAKMALLGNKTSAGSMVADTPYRVYSADEAKTYAGAKSELYAGALAAFRQNKNAHVYLCAVPEAGGAAAATAIVLAAGTFTAAGVYTLTLGGRAYEVVVSTTDTPTTAQAAMAAKINADTDAPFTAGVSTGTLTVTCANKGPRGNNRTLRAVTTVAGMTLALNGGSASATPGATRFGLGTAVAGAGADDITNSLAALASQKFDRIVVANDDATNITRLRNHVNTYSGVAERKRCQGECASVDTLSNAKTLATGQNAPLVRVNWHFDADNTTLEIAAQCCAAKLYGDGSVGGGVGRVKGEESYKACNLDGCLLATITQQVAADEQPLGTEIEDALNNGLTPLAPAPANPGYCRVVKSVTARSLDASSNPNYAVHDTSKVTVCHYVADQLEVLIANEFPNKNIGVDPGDGTGPTHPDVVFPSMVQAFAWKCAFDFERQGLLVKVADNPPTIEQDVNNPSMLLMEFPAAVIDHFHSLVGSVLQIA